MDYSNLEERIVIKRFTDTKIYVAPHRTVYHSSFILFSEWVGDHSYDPEYQPGYYFSGFRYCSLGFAGAENEGLQSKAYYTTNLDRAFLGMPHNRSATCAFLDGSAEACNLKKLNSNVANPSSPTNPWAYSWMGGFQRGIKR